MTFDWTDFASALQCLLLIAAAIWIFYAWRGRLDYRRALLGLVALAALNAAAQLAALWLVSPQSPVPTEFPVFSTFVLLGAVLGLAAAGWQARRSGTQISHLVDGALAAVLAGAIGARAYHVLAHLNYYSLNVEEIADPGQGGMGLRGGILLGLGALLLLTLLLHRDFWKLADAGAVGMALALSAGWWGASLTGMNYGAVSDSSFAQDLPDIYGIMAPRLPVQLAAAAAFLLLFLALAWAGHGARTPGALFLAFLVLFGLVNLALDSIRGDETLIVSGWRIDQFFDLLFAGFGLLVLGLRSTPFYPARRDERVEARS